MAGVKRISKTKQFKNMVNAAAADGVKAAGDLLLVKLKEALGVPGDRYHPSQPGEPPRKRTGAGQKGCIHKHTRKAGSIIFDGVSIVGFGPDSKYLWMHEKGNKYTRKKPGKTSFARGSRELPAGTRIERRPSLQPTFRKFKKTLGEAGIVGIKKGLSARRLK